MKFGFFGLSIVLAAAGVWVAFVVGQAAYARVHPIEPVAAVERPSAPAPATSIRLTTAPPVALSPRDAEMLALARAAAAESAQALQAAIDQGLKSEEDVFSTLYFPILPLTSPPTFSTAYDDYVDAAIKPIEDRYQASNKAIVFAIVIDRNGYVPSHNSNFSQPRTGDREVDLKINRTKRIFNDSTGFRAAKNEDEFLIQTYRRDTGERMKDLSVPVFVRGQRWGAFRIGYTDE